MQFLIRGLILCALCTACSTALPVTQAPPQPEQPAAFDILVFSKTVGWRHESIEAGIAALQKLGAAHDFSVTATEESAFFTSEDLTKFEAIIFLNTTLDIFNSAEQAAFEAYIQQGGGFVGVHGAADTEYDWPWYGELVGAYFKSHPDRQKADVVFTDRHHPASKNMPFRWNHYDEWYNYKANPRANVHVIAVVEEESYEGGEMGHDHPIAWAHHYDGGRAFYTGLGHTIESYSDPLFLEHLMGGIHWAAGQVDADVTATLASAFEEVVLTSEITNPMEIDITNDGRVFIIEWAGAVKIWEPDTNKMRVVGWIPVEKKIEDGLLGLALDPNFDENGWMYIYYSPIAEERTFNRLSRFTYDGRMIDMDSEIAVLEVDNQRTHCCHSGGSVQFDAQGNLYLSTGDNSGGDRDSENMLFRKHADQGRTAANTNDLRGKILRITPQPDGSYTIPEGNLFEADSLHRGEIYTMGHRNPFRISIDQKTGWIYWGDVGPNDERGYDEFNQAKGPGFFGWPLFTGRNAPFDEYHFAGAEGQMEAYLNPDAPVNGSSFNTGARELPPAQPSMIPYVNGTSTEFPELGAGGRNAMAGPVFHYDPTSASPQALPPYYDNKWMIYEWMRNWVMLATLDDQGDLVSLDPFLPGNDYISPMDIEVGPDGRLYIVEWGSQFWGNNENAQLVRLDYYGTDENRPKQTAPVTSGSGISIAAPADGGFFDFGDEITYKVDVTDQVLAQNLTIQTYSGFDTSPIPLQELGDASGTLVISDAYTHTPAIHMVDRFATIEACVEEGSARSCDSVRLNPKLKEAEHFSSQEKATRKPYGGHPASQHWGPTALTAMSVLKDSRLTYDPVNLAGISSITLRYLPKKDASISLWLGEEQTHLLATVPANKESGNAAQPAQAAYIAGITATDRQSMNIRNSTAYDGWREITIPVTNPGGTHPLTLSFESEENGSLLEIDFLRFNGGGISIKN